MNSKQLILSFINGATEGATSGQGNLKIKGSRLIHFHTTILERNNDNFIINMTRYSEVTGRVQKMIHELVPENKKKIITKVEKNYDGLLSEY